MVSLIPGKQRRPPPPSNKSGNNPRRLRSTQSDGSASSSSGRGIGKMKKRSPKQMDEEFVSLISGDGKPAPARNERLSKKTSTSGDDVPWTLTRFMKYLSLTCISAVFTFLLLRKQSKEVHWEEYKNILQPDVAKIEQRCFIADTVDKDQRCTCPDPSKPLARSETDWKKHHDAMYFDALHAPQNLDIVLFGDSIIERWNGTRHMGTVPLEGYREVFERKFKKKSGGKVEGLALGSSGDTGPNALWHLKNGVLEPLKPKVWLILVGTNDLYELKCTDRFVVANILNVLKVIADHQPDAQFILHGILPRKDKAESKTQFLGQVWKRAQAVNIQIRKFCDHKTNIHYMQAGPLFMEETETRGRQQIDVKKMADGVHPTKEGLEVWGDYIVKEVTSILHNAAEAKAAKDAGE